MSSKVAIEASCVLTAVRAHARAMPGQPALVGDEGEISYAELVRLVEERAGVRGERPGVPGVHGVPAVHEPHTVVDLLATWAAGGTYCPIDPAYPASHADAMLAALDGHDLDDTPAPLAAVPAVEPVPV
jgi:non-ribosomal peptide synthetase component F